MVVLAWMQSHMGLIAGSVAVLVNELFAWNPNLKSNSLLQFLLNVIGMVKK